MNALASLLRVLSWVVYGVIILALLIAAPILLGYRPMIVLSPSMEPVYPVDSIIYYHKADFEDINVQDPITFEIGEGGVATHRVVNKDEANRAFTTKGDNNPSEDGNPVSYDRVLGKAGLFGNPDVAIPFAGVFTRYVQKWYVIAVMAAILLGGMLVIPEKPKAPAFAGMQGAPQGYQNQQGQYILQGPFNPQNPQNMSVQGQQGMSGFNPQNPQNMNFQGQQGINGFNPQNQQSPFGQPPQAPQGYNPQNPQAPFGQAPFPFAPPPMNPGPPFPPMGQQGMNPPQGMNPQGAGPQGMNPPQGMNQGMPPLPGMGQGMGAGNVSDAGPFAPQAQRPADIYNQANNRPR